jgi:hypothetical protein
VLRLIDRELQGIDTHGRPLSVILVAVGQDGTDRCAAAIRSRLRHADALCDLGPAGLLVVAPDTGSQAAAGLVQDLARTLADDRPAPRVTSATATCATTAQQLVDETHRPTVA